MDKVEIEFIALEEVTIGSILFRKGASLPNGFTYQGLIDIGKVKIVTTKPKKIGVSIPVVSSSPFTIKIEKKRRGKKRQNKSSR